MSWTPGTAVHGDVLVIQIRRANGEHKRCEGERADLYPRNLRMEANTIISDNVNCYNMAMITFRRGATVPHRRVFMRGSHSIDILGYAARSSADRSMAARLDSCRCICWPRLPLRGAVLGACAVTFKDLDPWGVYIGNPAILKRKRISFNTE